MISTLIHWLVSAAILFLLQFVPFMNISFSGGLLSFIFVAIIIGLINALLVPIVKSIVKGKRGSSTALSAILMLIIDAAALLFASWLLSNFSIGLLTAIVAAAILSAVGAGFAAKKEK